MSPVKTYPDIWLFHCNRIKKNEKIFQVFQKFSGVFQVSPTMIHNFFSHFNVSSTSEIRHYVAYYMIWGCSEHRIDFTNFPRVFQYFPNIDRLSWVLEIIFPKPQLMSKLFGIIFLKNKDRRFSATRPFTRELSLIT